MLIGRASERERTEVLLAAARRGRAGALIVSGEPGIGKTALLADARGSAAAAGMRILTARGVESEAEVAFSALLELLRPILDGLDRLPEPQRRALRGALALGPDAQEDRFAVGVATLSLLATRAEDGPLLVVIDDAHWIDRSSAAAILFTARRLLADQVAVLLAVRPGEAPALEEADLPRLELAGLDVASATALVARARGRPVAPELGARLHRQTAGNPLALVEVAAGSRDLDADLVDAPLPVTRRIERAFLRRAAALSPEARVVLALAAAEGEGRLEVIQRASAALGHAPAAIEGAERLGLVAVRDAALEFRHPLVRSAAYHAVSPAERREVHRALAAALKGERDGDRRAWHLAAAAFGPDEEAARALESAAARARARNAHAAAATAFARAGRLSVESPDRARRLVAAAEAAWIAGHAEGVSELLAEALACAADPRVRADAHALRGHLAVRRGPVMEGHAILVDAARALAPLDHERAITLLCEAADAARSAGHAAPMLQAAHEAGALVRAETGDRARALAALALGMALVMDGQGAAGAERLRATLATIERSETLGDDPRVLALAAVGPLFLREGGPASALIRRAESVARAQGALGELPAALFVAGREAAASDRWGPAKAYYDEGVRLARETGQEVQLCGALAALAGVEAREGGPGAETHAREALALSIRLGLGFFELWALVALADLELGLGRLAEAQAHLEGRALRIRELGIGDVDLSPVPELVEVGVRAGGRGDARALALSHVRAARAKGQPWALARAERCRGLLAGETTYERHFREALRHHALTPDTFEEARTRLCLGERLRRDRQRARARPELRAAFEGFSRLGAAPWAERAREELAATGETARRREVTTLDQLTPQELRIALTLAEGVTVREAAGRHFLSAKTVEYHLRNVYRKLGIRSRDALAVALADGGRSGDEGTSAHALGNA